jgi:hypothetical protein
MTLDYSHIHVVARFGFFLLTLDAFFFLFYLWELWGENKKKEQGKLAPYP